MVRIHHGPATVIADEISTAEPPKTKKVGEAVKPHRLIWGKVLKVGRCESQDTLFVC